MLKNPIFIVAFTLVAILFVFSLNKTAKKSKVSQNNVSILEQNVSNLASEIEKEKYLLELTNTNLTKEKIIRNELLMQKPGEYVLQLPKETTSKADQEELLADQHSNLNKWLELLF